MRIGTAIAAAIGLAAIPQTAQAYVWCSGTVAASWVDVGGGVYIQASWHANHTQICNLSAVWKGISPEICMSWMAKMDAAVSMGRQVTVYYSGSETDCATLPTYENAPAPHYMMLR